MTAVPATFGKYYLTSKLATGGMAEIYLAKLIGPDGFEKPLVIKQIHPQYSSESQFVDLFVAEAKTLVSLSHGNIVPIYELGVVERIYFIAMEYIDGPTLERLGRALKRHGDSLSPHFASYITAEVLKGLDYAHRKSDGVIHRDLSPRNVMVSREGEVKLVDFGLAVHAEGRQLSRGAGGRPAGSFPYMSPEQVRGETLDPRSDLFSAGVLFWEMLTGRSLFADPDPDETLKNVRTADIPAPSDVNPEIPEVLDKVCLRALERDPDDRYQSAAKFLRPLTRFLYTSDLVIGPAELSRLVAQTCPASNPDILLSEHAPAASNPAGDDGGKHLGGTVVMEGRADGKSGKKKRADTVQTFATNAVWQEELREAKVETMPDGSSPPREILPDGTGEISRVSLPPTAARVWTTRLAVIAALGFAVLALALWRARGGDGARAQNQMPDARGATAISADAAITEPDAGTGMAGPIDAAAEPVDARPPRPSADARAAVRKKRDAGVRKTVGSGTLKIGAQPWANVSIDGVRVGQAPGAFPVSAGKHTVILEYKGERKTFGVQLEDGETKNLSHSFGSVMP
jgi:serine/threonine protein kinase